MHAQNKSSSHVSELHSHPPISSSSAQSLRMLRLCSAVGVQSPQVTAEVTSVLSASAAGALPRVSACSSCASGPCSSSKSLSSVRRIISPVMAPGPVELRETPEHLLASRNLPESPVLFPTREYPAPGQKPKKLYPGVPELLALQAVEASGETSSDRYSALENIVKKSLGGCGVLDGGLATELERRGADINDPLWSAKCLLEDESADLIRQVHYDYYKAGSDVSISASYQATIQGFESRGFSAEQAEELLARSVRLVVEARDQFWEDCQRQAVTAKPGGPLEPHDGKRVRQRPLVAASVGSYGAYLADGSEYSGEYGPDMTLEKLVEFHRRRVQVLAAAGPDLLAFETIPNLVEAQAFAKILEEENLGVPAWISFNSKDGRNVVRGDPFEDCVAVADACKHVVAVGINCTPPRFIKDLILLSRKVSSKLIVIYPNSGESWDGEKKEWVPQEATGATDEDFTSFAPEWVTAGANLIGGCCRTTPHTISCIQSALLKGSRSGDS